MANNTVLNLGTGGDTIADEDIAGVKYQLVKLVDSTATSTTRTGVAASPIQVSLANTAANATAVKVDNSAVTQPVSAASLPLPTGASTSVKQPALGTAGTASADVLSVQGVASMTALKVDGSAVTQPVSLATAPTTPVTGTFWQATQPVSGTVTANAGTNLNTSALALDATLTGGNQQVQGNIAAGIADSGNPVKAGGKYNVTAPTYADGQRGDIQIDSRGSLKVITANGTNPQSFKADNADAVAVSATVDKPAMVTRNSVFNGTSWDRMYNNATGAVLAAGATTAQTSATQTTYNASKLAVVINISAFTSGTLTFTVNGITSTGYTYPILVSTALAATGVTPLRIFPGATPSANATANDLVPRSYNVVVTGTFVATYGVDFELSV